MNSEFSTDNDHHLDEPSNLPSPHYSKVKQISMSAFAV